MAMRKRALTKACNTGNTCPGNTLCASTFLIVVVLAMLIKNSILAVPLFATKAGKDRKGGGGTGDNAQTI